MKRKTFSVILIGVLMLSLAFSGCSKSSNENNVKNDTVKVGWIGCLTGDYAIWGQAELNTVKMIFDDVNKNGGLLGKKIEVVGYDTRGDGQEALNAVKRLTSQDKVIAIIGPNQSGQAIPISSVLEDTKVADIATSATNPKVTVVDGKVKPYNFRVCFIDPYQGTVAAGFIYDKLNAKKAAVLYDTGDDYAQGLTQYFMESFEKKGGSTVAKEGYKSGDVDFRAQLTKIKTAQPDVIFLPLNYKDVALVVKQAKDLGIKATFMGGDGWASDQLVTMAGAAIEGSYFINFFDMNDPDGQSLKQKYEATFNKKIEISSFLGNDASLMLIDAIKRANSFDSAKIRDALETTDIRGITGRIAIGKDTHNPENKDAAIIKIEGGKLNFMQKYAIK